MLARYVDARIAETCKGLGDDSFGRQTNWMEQAHFLIYERVKALPAVTDSNTFSQNYTTIHLGLKLKSKSFLRSAFKSESRLQSQPFRH